MVSWHAFCRGFFIAWLIWGFTQSDIYQGFMYGFTKNEKYEIQNGGLIEKKGNNMSEYTHDEIKAMVEGAGATQFLLSAQGTIPSGYKSCNPEIKREFEDFVENEKQNLIRVNVTQAMMSEFMTVEAWMPPFGSYCYKIIRQPRVARAVQYRRMRSPIDDRRVLTDAKISRLKLMECSRAIIPRWYDDGISILTRIANEEL